MEKLLTVVIAAYNMEKYLPRCLDSIMSEKVRGRVQVIVVNDGSKDKTSEIAHRYEDKCPDYISVIDKENGNYGSCMNAGLSIATGKYFRTLDADDWYNTQNYERFVDELAKTDADMIISERYDFYEESKTVKEFHFKDDIVPNSDIDISAALWNSSAVDNQFVMNITYKTRLVKESGLRWSEGIFYSDSEFSYWPLRYVKTIRFIPYAVYYYFKGRADQSMSINSLKRNFYSADIVANKLLDDFLINAKEGSPVYKLQKKHVLGVLARFYLRLLFGGSKEKKTVLSLENKLKSNLQLYQESAYLDSFKGIYYIEEYRQKTVKYLFCRLYFTLGNSKLIKRIKKTVSK